MSYVALYRKFRPDTFEDVKGQDHIVTTLKNQIKSDRTGHAYLFCGTRGTGKTTIAKILAKAVNCENPVDGNPCGECETCKSIAAGVSMNVIEIDAASNNGVDNIRQIVDEVSYSPAEGKKKVYIIDEVHMLSTGAFNALLKTLEEPPAYVMFILATTEVHKIPITILSRCQRYDFRRIGIDTIAARLRELMDQEQIQVEEKALRYVAKAGDGSLRDALSLLDQCIAFHYGSELTYDKVLDVLGAVDTVVFSKLLRSILDRNVEACIDLLDEIVVQGRELNQFIVDFTWYLRNLLLAKTSEHIEDVIDMSTENLMALQEEAELLEVDAIIRYIRIFSDLATQIKYASQKRIMTEVSLIKLCRPQMETKKDALLDRIRALEEQVKNGVVVSAEKVSTAGSEAQRESAVPKKELPKAIPEDVEKAVGMWRSIVSNAGQPMRTHLQKAKLSLGGDNRLMVVFPDDISFDYFADAPQNKAELEKLISGAVQKQIEITIESYHADASFDSQYVDLSQLIQMEVEEADDTDSEYEEF